MSKMNDLMISRMNKNIKEGKAVTCPKCGEYIELEVKE